MEGAVAYICHASERLTIALGEDLVPIISEQRSRKVRRAHGGVGVDVLILNERVARHDDAHDPRLQRVVLAAVNHRDPR